MDEINLLPAKFLVRRRLLARLRAWFVVLAVTLLILPAAALTLRRYLILTEERVASLVRQHAQLKDRIVQFQGLWLQQQQLRTRSEVVNGLLSRAPLRQLFFDIAALTDEEIWLTQLQLNKVLGAQTRHPDAGAHRSQNPKAFFSLGRQATSTHVPRENTMRTGLSLSLQGFTMSNQRLADFMSELSGVPYLSKVNLQVARRGQFQTYDAIEFVIGIQL